MTKNEIAELWTEFVEWVHKEKGYFTVDGIWLVQLWYEFLDEKKRERKRSPKNMP